MAVQNDSTTTSEDARLMKKARRLGFDPDQFHGRVSEYADALETVEELLSANFESVETRVFDCTGRIKVSTTSTSHSDDVDGNGAHFPVAVRDVILRDNVVGMDIFAFGRDDRKLHVAVKIDPAR